MVTGGKNRAEYLTEIYFPKAVLAKLVAAFNDNKLDVAQSLNFDTQGSVRMNEKVNSEIPGAPGE